MTILKFYPLIIPLLFGLTYLIAKLVNVKGAHLPETYLYIKWGLIDAIIIYVFYYVISLLILIIETIITHKCTMYTAGYSIIVPLFTLVFIIMVAYKRGGNLQALGFKTKSLKYSLKWIMLPLSIIILYNLFHWKDIYLTNMEFGADEAKDFLNDKWFIFNLFLIAPIFEEVYVRGFMYPVFKKYIGRKTGIVLTALFFSILHSEEIFLKFLDGIILTYVYDKTQSIYLPIGIHFLINYIVSMLIFFQFIAGSPCFP